MKDLAWREFEAAVAAFISALDPTAAVLPNSKLPDAHTGKPRQRDIMVRTKVLNFTEINILISCKRYKRKLNQQDMDAFNGEFISSKANLGLIFSYSGFAKPAIEKAKQLGFYCCSLYQNQQPEIPEMLHFTNLIVSYSEYSIAIDKTQSTIGSLRKWKDILYLVGDNIAGETLTVLDILVKKFTETEKTAIENKESIFPKSWLSEFTIFTENNEKYELYFILRGWWREYKADIKAFLVNGMYSFTDKTFLGSVSSPSIDTYASEPGPGWARFYDRNDIPKGGISAAFIFSQVEKLRLRLINIEDKML
ncbi:MAG: restriction endonuclease [Nitrospirae bacterium]|nr:restriction endonuclease [Nitrospirota bacterium]